MSSVPAPFPRRPRSHFSRSRAGCLTCRTRRKKCDEEKPVCGGCERGMRTCNWPTPGSDGPNGAKSAEPHASEGSSLDIDPASFPADLPPGIVPVRIIEDNTSGRTLPPPSSLVRSGAGNDPQPAFPPPRRSLDHVPPPAISAPVMGPPMNDPFAQHQVTLPPSIPAPEPFYPPTAPGPFTQPVTSRVSIDESQSGNESESISLPHHGSFSSLPRPMGSFSQDNAWSSSSSSAHCTSSDGVQLPRPRNESITGPYVTGHAYTSSTSPEPAITITIPTRALSVAFDPSIQAPLEAVQYPLASSAPPNLPTNGIVPPPQSIPPANIQILIQVMAAATQRKVQAGDAVPPIPNIQDYFPPNFQDVDENDSDPEEVAIDDSLFDTALGVFVPRDAESSHTSVWDNNNGLRLGTGGGSQARHEGTALIRQGHGKTRDARGNRNRKKAVRQQTYFPGPPRGLWTLGDTGRLHSYSPVLFEHYIHHVAHSITTCDDELNPLLRYIIPLAQKNDLLMHAMLAAGGAYFCDEASGNIRLGQLARRHYVVVLRGLQSVIQKNWGSKGEDRVYLICLMLLMSLFETLAGGVFGGIVMHMQACRIVLSGFMDNLPAPNTEVGFMFGFLSEAYVFEVLVTSLSALLCRTDPPVPIDDWLKDLSFLSRYPLYRRFLNVSPSLFSMIPDIISFGLARYKEERAGESSPAVYDRYQELLARLRVWVDPEAATTTRTELRHTTLVWQSALIIVLHGLYYGDFRHQPEVWAEVNSLLETAFPLLLSVALSSNAGINLLFPCLIFGASTEQNWIKGTIEYGIMAVKFKSSSTKHALTLIRALWQDQSSWAFGPRGLGYIMQKQGNMFVLM